MTALSQQKGRLAPVSVRWLGTTAQRLHAWQTFWPRAALIRRTNTCGWLPLIPGIGNAPPRDHQNGTRFGGKEVLHAHRHTNSFWGGSPPVETWIFLGFMENRPCPLQINHHVSETNWTTEFSVKSLQHAIRLLIRDVICFHLSMLYLALNLFVSSAFWHWRKHLTDKQGEKVSLAKAICTGHWSNNWTVM